MRPSLKAIVFASVLVFPSVSSAQEAKDGDSFERLYGDGLRYYANGQYDVALENLYRAYATRPSDLLMKLIIRSHDFMGNCSAVDRQTQLFSELYPRTKAPTPQRCANPGVLEIVCSPDAGEVKIDYMIPARCGSSVKLPAGDHNVTSPQLNESQTFTVSRATTTRAELKLNPEKWVRSSKTPNNQEMTVLQTPDGIYQIWVMSNLRRDPDMEDETPGFTIIRRRDGLYDISSDALKEPYGVPSRQRGQRRSPNIPSISP